MTVIEMPVKLLKFFFSTDLKQSKETQSTNTRYAENTILKHCWYFNNFIGKKTE